MEANIWFYTFSTAAQVMAALVGLFAVFVVYKIQDFSELISEARSALSRLLPYVSANTGGDQIPIHTMVEMSDKEMLMTFAEVLVLQTKSQPFAASERVGNMTFSANDSTYDYFARLVNKKARILKRLLYILLLTLSSIAISLIALVFEDTLINYPWFIGASLTLFLICLGTIGVGIYQITLE